MNPIAPNCGCGRPPMSRRNFLASSAAAAVALALHEIRGESDVPRPKIDIHMHLGGSFHRTGEQMITHQKNIGATFTVILPASDADNGKAREFARRDPAHWICFARETVGAEGAVKRFAQSLQQGAVG